MKLVLRALKKTDQECSHETTLSIANPTVETCKNKLHKK